MVDISQVDAGRGVETVMSMKEIWNSLKMPLAACVSLGVLAMSVVFFGTHRFGVGLSPDSATYLSQAENLRLGRGFNSYEGFFSSHYPPGYQLIIATTSLVTRRDVRHGSPRLIAAVSFAVILVASALWMRLSGLGAVGTVAGLLGLAGHSGFVEASIVALSDVVFVAAVCLSLLFLELWHRHSDVRLLILAAVLSAIGVLVRYAGVVWPIACATAILIRDKDQLSARFKLSVGFCLFSFTPLLVWCVVARLMSSESTGRTIAFHPVDLVTLAQGCRSLVGALSSQELPRVYSAAIVLAVFSAVSAGLIGGRISLGRCLRGSPSVGVVVLLTYFLLYNAFLILSISFFDRATPLDDRILLSSIWCLILLMVRLVDWSLSWDVRVAQWSCYALICWFSVRGVWDTAPRLVTWGREGYLLACREVLYDDVLRHVRMSLKPGVRVYSNVSWTVWLACRREVRQLPMRVDYTSGVPSADYSAVLRQISDEVLSGAAVVVYDVSYADPLVLTPRLDELQSIGLRGLRGFESGRFQILSAAQN